MVLTKTISIALLLYPGLGLILSNSGGVYLYERLSPCPVGSGNSSYYHGKPSSFFSFLSSRLLVPPASFQLLHPSIQLLHPSIFSLVVLNVNVKLVTNSISSPSISKLSQSGVVLMFVFFMLKYRPAFSLSLLNLLISFVRSAFFPRLQD